MMKIQPIHSDADLNRAFARLEELWVARVGTPEADELQGFSILIDKYEEDSVAMQSIWI